MKWVWKLGEFRGIAVYMHATFLALMFAFMGILGNRFLIFIALFVWIGAAQEAGMVTMKAAMAGVPVQHAMMPDFRTLRPGDSLK